MFVANVQLLPDDQIALFQALADLDLDWGLDTDSDRRSARAVALADFNEAAALERADRCGWQPQHIFLVLQDNVDLHYRARCEQLAFGIVHCEARGAILPLHRAAAPGTKPLLVAGGSLRAC